MADILAKSLKSPKDVSKMTKKLAKVAMERALEIEMEEHLGEKTEGKRPNGNSRNGYSQKTLKTDAAEIDLEIPRDREGSFEPRPLVFLILKRLNDSNDCVNRKAQATS